MFHTNKKLLSFAACLAALAGYIDAIGFLHLGGFFLSFMSGNSTRLAVGVTNHSGAHPFLPALIIFVFVLGAMGGSTVGHHAGKRRCTIVLGFVTGALFLAALLEYIGNAHAAIICAVLATGAVNTAFEQNGEVKTGLTYMTGNLVKLGQRLAALFWGGSMNECLQYAALWAALIAGACAGTREYDHIGLASLWFAAGSSAILTGISFRLRVD